MTTAALFEQRDSAPMRILPRAVVAALGAAQFFSHPRRRVERSREETRVIERATAEQPQVAHCFTVGRIESYELFVERQRAYFRALAAGRPDALDTDLEQALRKMDRNIWHQVAVQSVRPIELATLRRPVEDRLVRFLEEDQYRDLFAPIPLRFSTDFRVPYLLLFPLGVSNPYAWTYRKAVLVNDSAYGNIDLLRRAYPKVQFVRADEFEGWLTSQLLEWSPSPR